MLLPIRCYNYRYRNLTLILYAVVAYLYLLEYLANSFSAYKCARYCCFFFVLVWAFLGKAYLECFLVPLHVFIVFILQEITLSEIN